MPVSGVTMNLTGNGRSFIATTDDAGRYSFLNAAAGYAYTLTATKAGLSFIPAPRQFVLNSEAPLNFYAGATALFAVSAANYKQPVASGSLVTLFGVGLASGTRAANTIPLPTELDGTSVSFTMGSFNDFPCRLLFVSPQQINFAIPLDAGPPLLGEAFITVKRNGLVIAAGSLSVEPSAPGLFSIDATGRGLAAALALRVKADNSQVYESIVRYDTALARYVAVPIDLSKAGEAVYLVLFGTGMRFQSDTREAKAKAGEQAVPLLYAGTQGGNFIGLDQANLLLPVTLAGRGEMPVIISVNGKVSNAVTVVIK